MKVHYDLDRDGRDETLSFYHAMVSLRFIVEKEGVRASTTNCGLPQEVGSFEIALREINGDRRPEIFFAYDADGVEPYGRFCILEFKGFEDLPALRRGNLGIVEVKDTMFRTLLDINSGWYVTVATDGSLRRCAGTGCADPWNYLFDGRQYVAADQFTPDNDVASKPADPMNRSAAPATSRAEQVAAFVESSLLRPGPRRQAELRALYGDSVDYFGKRGMAVKDVLKDKVQYFKRWPERDFRLDRSTMSVTTEGQELSIQFEYSYDVSGQKGRRSGRGVSMMRLREAANGSFVILSENGRTL